MKNFLKESFLKAKDYMMSPLLLDSRFNHEMIL